MQNTPFFSVIIPVYNKGPHIHRSISSVLNQTNQNFELIVVNDASTDNSMEEIQKFSDKRIRLFQRPEPGPGGYAARNLGIDKAQGEWIAFLDADDEWYPNHLEKMYEVSQKYADVYFMGCGWDMQNNGIKKENAFYKANKTQKTLEITLTDYLKAGLSRKLPVCTSVACVKKSSPIALNLFPANLNAQRGGDLHAWLKMMCFHKKMAWSNHIGAIYHLDSVNMVTKKAETSPQLRNKSIYTLLSKHLTTQESKLLLKYFNQQIFNSWMSSILRGSNNFIIANKLFWKNDFFNALKYSIISFIPISILRLALNSTRKFKNKRAKR